MMHAKFLILTTIFQMSKAKEAQCLKCPKSMDEVLLNLAHLGTLARFRHPVCLLESLLVERGLMHEGFDPGEHVGLLLTVINGMQ